MNELDENYDEKKRMQRKKEDEHEKKKVASINQDLLSN